MEFLSRYSKKSYSLEEKREQDFENFCLHHFSEQTQKEWKNRKKQFLKTEFSYKWINGVSTAHIHIFKDDNNINDIKPLIAKETVSFISKSPYL